MQSISSLIGIPADQLVLISGLMLAIPISIYMKTIQSSSAKIWLNIVLGTLMQWFLYGREIFYLWVQTCVVYLMCRYLPRRQIGRYVVIETAIYLLVIQFHRYLSLVTTNLDITAILMISTTKYMMVAFCYQDGGIKKQELTYPTEQQPRKLVELPSFLSYLAYIQFVPSSLIGPTFQFSDFINYIHSQGEYKSIPSAMPALVGQFKKSAFFVIVYVVLDSIFKVDYLVSKEFARQGILLQSAYVIITIIAFKFKYYSAWSMSTLGIKASGISYQEVTLPSGVVEGNFQKIQYANPLAIELDPSFKVKIDSWNICVQVFFRRYIYQRLLSQKEQKSVHAPRLKKRAQMLTMVYSTFWHGFYPGYLLSFFHWMLVLQITQELFRVKKSNVKLYGFYQRHKAFQYLAILLSDYAFSYIGVFFHLYHLDRIWVFASVHWFAQLFLIYLTYYMVVVRRVFDPRTPGAVGGLANKQQQLKGNGDLTKIQ